MPKKNTLLAQLVKMNSPEAVIDEVHHLLGLMGADSQISRLETVFSHISALYHGKYPSYRSCNTHYHDLRHTTDVFLTLARLLHGAHEARVKFSSQEVLLALISTLMHDTGYIQKSTDRKGTGGKYTLTHVARSVAFMEEYFPKNGFDEADLALCESFVLGTSISVDFTDTSFPTSSAALLGKMIATADLLGQLSDRIYLEKLLFLYREFRESNIVGYTSELELLNNTVGFYRVMQVRLESILGNVQHYMANHFRARWQIEADLYQEAIAHNIAYLNRLLANHQRDYRAKLKREGIVAKLERIESADKSP
jgi:hypothetical protein